MRIFAVPHRVAAILLLTYPAARIAEAAFQAAEYGYAFQVGDPSLIILTLLYGAASAGMWHARRWAYGLGLGLAAFSAGVLTMVGVALDANYSRSELSPFGIAFAGTVIATQIAAIVLLLRRETRARFSGLEPARAQARLVAATVSAEILLMGAVAIWGFGGPGGSWYQFLPGGLHLPGQTLLVLTNWCCGYSAGLIISDAWVSRWGGLTRAGIPILMYANAIGLLPLAMLIRRAMRIARRRRSSTIAGTG